MLPLTLDVARLPIVLIGRGDAVRRRLAALDEADARSVRVFSDDPTPDVTASAGDRLRRHLPTQDDLAAARLVLIAGLPDALSERLAAAARARGALVNVEDVAALCDVHMPAVVRRGALTVAISTSGRSPGLARLLKGVFERLLDPRWGQWLDELAAQRARWRDAGLAMAEVGRRTAAWVLRHGWLGGFERVRSDRTLHPNLPPRGGKEADFRSAATLPPPSLRGRVGEGEGSRL
jgi:precorrin-2 dehydrogenase/sirohydrochlorin ferrochelatase